MLWALDEARLSTLRTISVLHKFFCLVAPPFQAVGKSSHRLESLCHQIMGEYAPLPEGQEVELGQQVLHRRLQQTQGRAGVQTEKQDG
jgi:hypothetical protein